MYRTVVVLVGLIGGLVLASCRSSSAGDGPLVPPETVVSSPVSDTPARPGSRLLLNTPLPATSAALATPAAAVPTTPAEVPRAASQTRPAPVGTAAARQAVAGAAVGAAGEPTPLPISAVRVEGSNQLKRLAIDLDERVASLRQALREQDVDAAARLQRELVAMSGGAEALVQGEQSELANQLRRAYPLLQKGLSGDLSRIDDAARILQQLTGRPIANRLIGDLYRYAGELAGKVGAFKKAHQSGDIGALFRLQHDLLGELERARAELAPGRTELAEAMLAAVADLQAGLGGDRERLDRAEAALRGIAANPVPPAFGGRSGTSETATATPSGPTPTPQPVATSTPPGPTPTLQPATTPTPPLPTPTPQPVATPTPPLPTPTPQPIAITLPLWLEAEAGSVRAPMAVLDDPGASGGRYVATSQTHQDWNGQGAPPAQSGLVELAVELPRTGRYVVWSRLWYETVEANSYWLRVDGQTTLKVGNEDQGYRAWRWVDWRDGRRDQRIVLELKAGKHTLTLVGREAGARIDALVLTDDSTWTPERR